MYQSAKETSCGKRGTSRHWHWSADWDKLFGSQRGKIYKSHNFTCPLTHLFYELTL